MLSTRIWDYGYSEPMIHNDEEERTIMRKKQVLFTISVVFWFILVIIYLIITWDVDQLTCTVATFIEILIICLTGIYSCNKIEGMEKALKYYKINKKENENNE